MVGKWWIVKKLFWFVYMPWYRYDKIVKVHNWRYATIETKNGCIKGSSPVFWWEDREIYGGFWSYFMDCLKRIGR